MTLQILKANWPAPSTITAFTSQRFGGVSLAPYDSLNLGLHVGDLQQQVLDNRQRLQQQFQLPDPPHWLVQTHSTRCVRIESDNNRQADAAVTSRPGNVLAIMTADCLPILLCNETATEIAAIHAGWRGLVYGVIEETLAKMQSPPEQIMAWIGPAICASCYEVGDNVRDEACKRYSFASNRFQARQGQWLANLPALAQEVMQQLGILAVYQSNACTFEEKNNYFSYRREAQTGRIASLIWINQDKDNATQTI